MEVITHIMFSKKKKGKKTLTSFEKLKKKKKEKKKTEDSSAGTMAAASGPISFHDFDKTKCSIYFFLTLSNFTKFSMRKTNKWQFTSNGFELQSDD